MSDTRGASFHLQPIYDARFAAAHNFREWTEKYPAPKYLLPEDYRLGHFSVIASENIISVHRNKLEVASGKAQALAKVEKFSPIWDGVLNLPHPTGVRDQEKWARMVRDFCSRYEKLTGHKVIAADIHADEGRIENNMPIYNIHAHIIVDRTNDKGRPIVINKVKIKQIQDLAAQCTGLVRGADASETQRPHLSASLYRRFIKTIDKQQEKEISKSVLEIIDAVRVVAELYGELRGLMKASKRATQEDYQEAKNNRENQEWIEAKIIEYEKLMFTNEKRENDERAQRIARKVQDLTQPLALNNPPPADLAAVKAALHALSPAALAQKLTITQNTWQAEHRNNQMTIGATGQASPTATSNLARLQAGAEMICAVAHDRKISLAPRRGRGER